MSFDQKPARVRVYSSGVGQGAAAPAAAGGGGDSGVQVAEAAGEAKRSGSIMVAIIFLIGCALGGAVYTALPHFGLI